MVPPSKREELDAAWRALAGHEPTQGWRTIPVSSGGSCRLLAGRSFPSNEEALLVGFAAIHIPLAEHFPQGTGFLVSRVEIADHGTNVVWIALCRKSTGNFELFTMMVDDIVTTLERQNTSDHARLFQVFISRIRAWQEFMRRGEDVLLGPEAEAGLAGELLFMHELLNSGLPAATIIDAWQGPLDGLHDFSLGNGAIEVKSTVSVSGFPAKVGTLDQLDDSLIHPLFLAAVRLALTASGKTLSILIEDTRTFLKSEPAALADFDTRLLHAGYLGTTAERYTRSFAYRGFRILRVTEDFPRLTRANVPIAIRNARYEIDLDLVSSGDIDLANALKQLGVL